VAFQSVPLSRLRIRDERSFAHIALYGDLKARLVADGYQFRVPAKGDANLSWSRALFLNLTFWNAGDNNDVLEDASIDADVVAHAAWHHVVRLALDDGQGPATADALLFGESVASAFDLYLVGRVLGHVRRSAFLASQVPAMTRAAMDAGQSEADVEALLHAVADDPEQAFEDLRALLFDLSMLLVRGPGGADVDAAAATLDSFRAHRFAGLLHHYELATWVLYARAYGRPSTSPDARVQQLDADTRAAPVALDWLQARCLAAPPTDPSLTTG
jgi:hypothetical protein